MVKDYEVIGYAADADIWCIKCLPYDDPDTDKDSEGNEIHPIFVGDEDSHLEYCNACGENLWEAFGLDPEDTEE